MRRAKPTSASSGWEWNSQGPRAPHPPRGGPQPPRGGSTEAVLAGVVFFVIAAIGVAAYFVLRSGSGDADPVVEETNTPAVDTAAASEAPPKPTDAKPTAAPPRKRRPVPSLDNVSWTVEAPTTLKDLSTAWSVPRDVLTKLNPKLPTRKPIEAGRVVIVHAKSLGASSSIGPPNNGRLIWGVPLPENEAWLPPEDRTRAFATAETIASVVAGFYAYADQFPDAAPIVVGDLSARRGGKIYGHQSHQSGQDIDIRLVKNSTGEGFDAARNWFLVKTLIDQSEVRAVFLNRTEQTWLRTAADADVGAASAEPYFSLIRHEPGHTIHMHVRFACSKEDKRCVGYSLPDTQEEDPSKKASKLPTGPSGGTSKRPRLVPKNRSKKRKTKKTKKTKRKTKKKGKKKKKK